ncbi:acetyl-CoA synthetase-like protein [Eremomyces bilateralis CBS 781.70]|uniref:Acetyl-CoA synthetase-like protein n=1 Tax=Eremomyces bilateralis CBS 781.70 TaxID=1392243 RepID=A0A6G1FRJ9_9PEZI|nr:acetyl-CoA synthetase-like protein [Eremomyces bilateralis CBS 781.70]KAF1808424.1 acetyl-CoA synthetase-like protein [Eremomyces bilateralis CBS 781.70]
MSYKNERSQTTQIDHVARTTPDRIVAYIPHSTDINQGFRSITAARYARAVNVLCESLEPRIGRSTTHQAIGYIGKWDFRYHWVALALKKLGFVGLYSAPRNSPQMHRHIFESKQCGTLLHSEGLDIAACLGDKEMNCIQVPLLDALLADGKAPREYPYEKTFEEVWDEPFVIVHTSGSTGMPKTLNLTNGFVSSLRELGAYPPKEDGRNNVYSLLFQKVRYYCNFPPWHTGGILIGGPLLNFYGESEQVWHHPDSPPTPKTIIDAVNHGKVYRAVLAPVTIQGIAMTEGGLDALGRMDTASFSGGPLDKVTGNLVSKRTNLYSIMGSTEGGVTGLQYIHKPEDWEYIEYDPEASGIEFREQSPGRYELVFVQTPAAARIQGIFNTFPDRQEYLSSDLYSKHPTLPNHWKFQGRTDDLVVFASGAKHNPLSFEENVRLNNHVSEALVFGTGRMAAGLLIEMKDTPLENWAQAKEVLDSILASVEAANTAAPKHAVVQRSLILFTSASSPFMRASKGTVVRKRSLDLYGAEIEKAYANCAVPDMVTSAVTEVMRN